MVSPLLTKGTASPPHPCPLPTWVLIIIIATHSLISPRRKDHCLHLGQGMGTSKAAGQQMGSMKLMLCSALLVKSYPFFSWKTCHVPFCFTSSSINQRGQRGSGCSMSPCFLSKAPCDPSVPKH